MEKPKGDQSHGIGGAFPILQEDQLSALLEMMEKENEVLRKLAV